MKFLEGYKVQKETKMSGEQKVKEIFSSKIDIEVNESVI